MKWNEFVERALGALMALLSSRKTYLTAAACVVAYQQGQAKLVPLLLLALAGGIALEDAAIKLGIPWPFSEEETEE